MSYLLIYAHPNRNSFSAAIKDAIVNKLRTQGKDVVVRDLYELEFNPVLSCDELISDVSALPADIKIEQECVSKADVLIFIYPVWWFNMPAILRGYIDRVFSNGFAYAFADGEVHGLLSNKKVYILNTTGGGLAAYEQFGFNSAIQTSVDAGIFSFCGMSVALHKYFYAVPTSTEEERKKILEEIKTLEF